MPKIVKQVEADVSHEEVIEDLKSWLAETKPHGVRLGDAQSVNGEEINVGDILIPKPEVYTATPIVLDTYMMVVQIVERAGMFLGLFLTRDGKKGYQFFQGHQFEGKYEGAKPKAKPTRSKK